MAVDSACDGRSCAGRGATLAPDSSRDALPPLRVAIVGVPNSGKSLVFRHLTGTFALSANYPATTQTVARTEARLAGRQTVVYDTPGISGLEALSEDEEPTRALLRDERPDVVVQCVDAGNLVRSLLLTAQLADEGVPLVVCLNMVDEAAERGLWVDPEALSREVGVPVVATCACDGRGLRKLGASFSRARPARPVRYPTVLRARLDAQEPERSRAERMERVLAGTHPDLRPGQSLRQMALEAHRHWAGRVAAAVVHETGLEQPRSWDVLLHLVTHPLGGWASLAAVGVAVYLLVAKVGAGLLAGAMDAYVIAPVTEAVADLAGEGVLRDVLVGDFGLLSLGLLNAVGTVVPILTVFFLAFAFLEDVGFFPLLSVHMDRLLRAVGLNGRAVLPLILGFGCNAVATLMTRGLDSDRQRFISCFLIALGIPCAVQLGVMLSILSTAPVLALVGLAAIVVVLEVGVGTYLARRLPADERCEFLVELPRLRRPRLACIVSKTGHRLWDFLREAVPLFVAGAALLTTLHLTGLLDRLRAAMAPLVVSGLGLPTEATDALLMTLARREIGAVMMKDMVDAGAMDLRQIFVGLLVMTLFVPCVNNTFVLWRVVGWRRTLTIFVAVTSIAVAAGLAVNAAWP